MAKELLKQDRAGIRRPADVERKYRLGIIEPTAEEVEELKEKVEVDSFLSTSSIHPVQNKVITNALNGKVTKENGKGLSTNDFTDEYKSLINTTGENSHTHNNKSVLDGLTQTVINNSHTHSNKSVLDSLTQTVINNSHTHSNKSVLDSITQTKINNWDNASSGSSSVSTYNLASYKVSALSILRSSCVVKNDRVCINFVGTISMNANTTTTIFNLPSAIRPTATKDFVVFGQSSNNDGYVGYGYITSSGLTEVRFNQAISSYIRFSTVYDLD